MTRIFRTNNLRDRGLQPVKTTIDNPEAIMAYYDNLFKCNRDTEYSPDDFVESNFITGENKRGGIFIEQRFTQNAFWTFEYEVKYGDKEYELFYHHPIFCSFGQIKHELVHEILAQFIPPTAEVKECKVIVRPVSFKIIQDAWMAGKIWDYSFSIDYLTSINVNFSLRK